MSPPSASGLGRLATALLRPIGRLTVLGARASVGSEFVPPWDATVVQDLALRRPLNLLYRVLRLVIRVRAASRLPVIRLRPGATIAIVNWNSLDLLQDVLAAVERFSPAGTEIVVVDNGSTDGSPEYLRSIRGPGRRVLLLSRNLYHGPAMDLAFLSSGTKYVVALDVDAFPVQADWLSQLLVPLTAGATVSGAEAQRGYVHPCCLAISLERFAAMKHTFTPHVGDWDPERLGAEEWDTGESITRREGLERAVLFPRTRVRGPLQLGSVFGGFVYHNGASTRLRDADTRIDGLTRGDAERAWGEALAEFLGPEATARGA